MGSEVCWSSLTFSRRGAIEGDAEGSSGRIEDSSPSSLCSVRWGEPVRHLQPIPDVFQSPLLFFHSSVHFFTYDQEFITQYCQVSALLELESLLSQQSLREAFSDAELSTAKQRHQQVQDYIQVRTVGARWEGAELDCACGMQPGVISWMSCRSICAGAAHWSYWLGPHGVSLRGSSRQGFVQQ